MAVNLPPNIPPASFNSVQAFCAINTTDLQFYNGINVASVTVNASSVKIAFRGPFPWLFGHHSVEVSDNDIDGTNPWVHQLTINQSSAGPGQPEETDSVTINFWKVNPADGVCTEALPKRIWFAAFKHGDGFVPAQATI